MKKLIFYFSLLCLLTANLSSRDKNITILVTDSLSRPIKDAVVELYHPIFSDVYFYSKTDSNGIAELSIPDYCFKIKISHRYYNQLKSNLVVWDNKKYEFKLKKCTEFYSLNGKFINQSKNNIYFVNSRLYNGCLNNLNKNHEGFDQNKNIKERVDSLYKLLKINIDTASYLLPIRLTLDYIEFNFTFDPNNIYKIDSIPCGDYMFNFDPECANPYSWIFQNILDGNCISYEIIHHNISINNNATLNLLLTSKNYSFGETVTFYSSVFFHFNTIFEAIPYIPGLK